MQISQSRVKDYPEKPLFSILIPSWNNLEYLQLCVRSLQQQSNFKHQIIVIVNEGKDGTLNWIQESDLDYVYFEQNAGICYALNACRKLIRADYILYANDDMYFLPNWDKPLWDEAQKLGHSKFMLSSTMIEPFETGNNCVSVGDFGDSVQTFKETDLLASYEKLYKNDWSGSMWPPNLMAVEMWDLVGGMSVEFTPGMYSDPDLCMKFWKSDVRYFKGIGNSLVYHFGTKTTTRIKKNNGYYQFLRKWGIDSGSFTKFYLRRGHVFEGELQEPVIPGKRKLKIFYKNLMGYFKNV